MVEQLGMGSMISDLRAFLRVKARKGKTNFITKSRDFGIFAEPFRMGKLCVENPATFDPKCRISYDDDHHTTFFLTFTTTTFPSSVQCRRRRRRRSGTIGFSSRRFSYPIPSFSVRMGQGSRHQTSSLLGRCRRQTASPRL